MALRRIFNTTGQTHAEPVKALEPSQELLQVFVQHVMELVIQCSVKDQLPCNQFAMCAMGREQ